MVKRSKVAVAVAAILGSASAMRMLQAEAQEAPADNSSANEFEPVQLEEVTITGLRRSLQEAMEIKRDAIGVVDAISAEDIGKFPDQNLSEALQRITGISIDRRNGEGALVTARGFGAEFNMVTLNGRTMPTADAFANGAATSGGIGGNTRSFNFANLASEAISGIEVYKTGKADIAAGGIGATVNVRTAKPFDNDGTVANVGVKLVNDTTNRVGDDYTPEVSGIFSFTDDSRKWGVGLSASYQKRDSGASGSSINDWQVRPWDPANDAGGVPLAVDANDNIISTIVNAPEIGQLYAIPNDIRYHFNDRERERTNAQLTFQFAPFESLTLTTDYTYALTNLVEDRGDQTVWMARNGFTYIEFDDGAVATPVVLQEFTGQGKDFGYEQQHREQKNDLKSIGFNANWQVTDKFNLSFDFHDSQARSLPDDPLTGGGETTFSLAGNVPGQLNCEDTDQCTNFWTQTFMFNRGLPVAARTLYPTLADARAGTNGNSDFTFSADNLGSQVLRIFYQDQVTNLNQARLDGQLQFDLGGKMGFNDGRFQFGVESRALDSRQKATGSNLTMGDWGVTDTGKVPDMVALLQPFSLVGAFEDFNAPGAPVGGFRGNANELALWAFQHGYTNWTEGTAPDGQLRVNPAFNTDNLVEEDTNAAYFQFGLRGELFGGRPANLVVGLRYEQTDVTSTAFTLVPTALLWQDNNDFQVQRGGEVQPLVEVADYSNVLPNLDFDIMLTDNLKSRFSYSKTIARAGYGNLAAGDAPGTPGGSTLVGGFTPGGNSNNPALVPLESDNFDLSLEYYFNNRGYVSVGFWDKRVDNFIGNTIVRQNLFGIRDQTAGPRAIAARDFLQQNGFAINDTSLFTLMAMMENPEGFTDSNGVTWLGGAENFDGSEDQHRAFAAQFDILPTGEDPLYEFDVSTPANQKKARIYGWELGGQYFFGDTGFGLQANYTIVKGDVGFDDTSDPNQNQFALLGLSDSANAVLIYEKFGWTARLAYNWRDEFLANINVGQFRNPIYVEAYDQFDLSVGYNFNENLSVTFEGLNITEEDVRWHGRSDNQMWFLEDQGARYAVGVRYRF